MEWIQPIIPHLKAVHIVALSLWCGGLLVVPFMLSRHDPASTTAEFRRIRRATHLTYTIALTPAAVTAVVAGTWLIFFREVLVPWMYAKLLFVMLLVAAHAWVGHIIVSMGESGKQHRPPPAYLPAAAAFVPMLAILVLVLGKPDLSGIEFPDWLIEPRGGQLPFDVPRR